MSETNELEAVRLYARDNDLVQAERRIAALEAALAKQRAANEAFLAWFAALSQEERDGFAAPLASALRETLK